MSYKKLVCTCLSWLIIQTCLVGQEMNSEKIYGLPFIQNYSPEDYGAAGQNWGVTQDTLGIMYFANTSGIISFDGVKWKTIKLSNGRQAKSIDQDTQGRIFIGGYDEIGYLDLDSLGSPKFESLLHLVPEEEREFRDVWATLCTEDGVFFQTNNFVFRYDGDTIESFPKSERVFHVSWKVQGKYYVREHGKGLLKYIDGKLELIPGGEKLASTVIRTVLPAPDGGIWISNSRGEILSLNDGEISKTAFTDNIQKTTGVAFMSSGMVLEDEGGYILNSVGEGNFLFNKNGELLYQLTKKNGIIDNTTDKSYIDKDGNLWLATQGGISHVLLNHPMTFSGEKLGVDRAIKHAIEKEDKLFLASKVGVLKEVDEGFEWIYETGLEIFDLEIIQGKLYAVFESYVAEITDDDQKVFVGDRQYPHWRMTKLDHNPDYYVAGVYNGGLLMYRGNGQELIQVGPVAGYRGNAANIIEDENGHLWISDGSMQVDRVTLNESLDSVIAVRTYGVDDGLFEDNGNHILSLNHEEKKRLLVASGPNYYIYEPGEDNFQPYEPLNDLTSGEKGIPFLQTRAGDIYTYAGGKPVRYTQNSGTYVADTLSLRKLPKNRAESIVELADESLLFCTSKGLIHHRPNSSESPSNTDFKTLIRKVESTEFQLYGGHHISELFASSENRLKYENNDLIFTYTASYYDAHELTTYQYQLEGYDEVWSDWSTATYKEYTNLSEGKYTFKVRAKNIYGTIGSTDSMTFLITPPWYRATMSYPAYALALFLLIWGLIRLNTRRLEAENRRLEQVVAERTIEIEEQKDELKEKNQKLVELDQFKQDMTSMVVHDLKNPLSIIIQKGEQKTSSIARKMLNLVLNILDVQKFEDTKVEPQKEKVSFQDLVKKAYAEVEDGFLEKNLTLDLNGEDYDIEVDPELIERVIINLFTNAVKYSPLNSKINLEIGDKDGFLKMILTDSGPGIPAEKQAIIFDRYIQSDRKIVSRVQSTGLGLAFCKLAIEAHDGMVGVESNQGEGASFWITLPISGATRKKIELDIVSGVTSLTETEIEAFKSILPQLNELKIYESLEIEALLAQLNAEPNSGLQLFIDDILGASYNGNDEHYSDLMNRYS